MIEAQNAELLMNTSYSSGCVNGNSTASQLEDVGDTKAVCNVWDGNEPLDKIGPPSFPWSGLPNLQCLHRIQSVPDANPNAQLSTTFDVKKQIAFPFSEAQDWIYKSWHWFLGPCSEPCQPSSHSREDSLHPPANQSHLEQTLKANCKEIAAAALALHSRWPVLMINWIRRKHCKAWICPSLASHEFILWRCPSGSSFCGA